MSIPESARICQNERTAARVIDGQAVVISIDAQKLRTLNAVGTRIWELAAEGRSLASIVDTLAEEFEVDRAEALADTRAFVEQLCSAGALEVRTDDT